MLLQKCYFHFSFLGCFPMDAMAGSQLMNDLQGKLGFGMLILGALRSSSCRDLTRSQILNDFVKWGLFLLPYSMGGWLTAAQPPDVGPLIPKNSFAHFTTLCAQRFYPEFCATKKGVITKTCIFALGLFCIIFLHHVITFTFSFPPSSDAILLIWFLLHQKAHIHRV